MFPCCATLCSRRMLIFVRSRMLPLLTMLRRVLVSACLRVRTSPRGSSCRGPEIVRSRRLFASSGRGLRAPRVLTRLVVLFRCLYRLPSRLLLLLNSKGPGLGGCCVLALCAAGKHMLVFDEAV